MVIVNPFDLLDVGEDNENYDNDEVLFREAEKKALEDAKANAAAKEIAKFAALRAAAEKEDRDRADAKDREEKERRKSYALKKKKEKEEEEKKQNELSQSVQSEKAESESSSLNGEDRISRKQKVRKPTIKVFPGDCEKPRLPPLLPRKKLVEPPIVDERPSSPQSNHASGYGDGSAAENYEQISDLELNNGQRANQNGNTGDYERPPSRIRTHKHKNAGPPQRSINARKDEEPVVTSETEGNALPEESSENNEPVVSDDNKVRLNIEKNEPVVADEDKEKKEEVKNFLTLLEYQKVLEEKRKKLPAKATEERKVQLDSELKEMKQLFLNKGDEEIFIKLGSDKDGGNRKKASKASGNGKSEKSITSADIFRFQRYQRPTQQVRPFAEGDGGNKTNLSSGNQGNGRGDRQQGQVSSHAAAPYNGSQGRGNSQQYRAPFSENQGKGRVNPPAARGDFGGQSRAPYFGNHGNQSRGRDGYPQSNGGARAPKIDIQTDFPPL